jgi:hypothetical protein
MAKAINAAAVHAAHPLPIMLFRPASTGACAFPRFPFVIKRRNFEASGWGTMHAAHLSVVVTLRLPDFGETLRGPDTRMTQ